MKKFLLISDRIINLYVFYIVMALFLSIVPSINTDYPLFHFIFVSAGFYIKLPFVGAMFSPMLIMICLVLISSKIRKLYIKLYEKDAPEIIIWTREDFAKNLDKFNKLKEKIKQEMTEEELETEEKENLKEENKDNDI